MHCILVLSGKGGVGKSSVTAQFALTLSEAGKKVGVLDIDLCGPSMPLILGIRDAQVTQSSKGWMPVKINDKLKVMSIGFLLEDLDSAVVWRGPKKQAMIRQFIRDVDWGDDLDYLLIDTPPGTSDEHIAILDAIRDASALILDGAILVTTPQEIALADVRKEYNFCVKTGITVLGLIENMSGYICPHCDDCFPVFSKGGGQSMAKSFGIRFLGKVPLTPSIAEKMDNNSLIHGFKSSPMFEIFKSFASNLHLISPNHLVSSAVFSESS